MPKLQSVLATLTCATALLLATAAEAQQPPCQPCAGIRVEDPAAVLESLAAAPGLEDEARLYVAWQVTAADLGAVDVAAQLETVGATPWPVLRLFTPAPLMQHLDELETELEALATITAASGTRGHVQIDWRPGGAPVSIEDTADLGFLVKRAAVTVTGANADARVILGPLPLDPEFLRALYAEDVAPYVDGIAIKPGPDEALLAMKRTLDELDQGRPLVLDSLVLPEIEAQALALAADASESQIAITFFRAPVDADLTPLMLLANEFSGDISIDPYSVPTGGKEAWSFVSGKDFSLRVLVEVAPGTDELTLNFADAQLRDPKRLLSDGQYIPLLGTRRTQKGVELTIADPDPVTVIKVSRLTAAEIEGIAGLDEELTVRSERTVPVGEILRRLQAFEDAQARRLETYTARNALSLRLQGSSGTQSVEVTFQGDFFFRQGSGYDWAWQELFVNGVRWRSEKIPQIPLLQPEKASALPAEISFTKDFEALPWSRAGTAGLSTSSPPGRLQRSNRCTGGPSGSIARSIPASNPERSSSDCAATSCRTTRRSSSRRSTRRVRPPRGVPRATFSPLTPWVNRSSRCSTPPWSSNASSG